MVCTQDALYKQREEKAAEKARLPEVRPCKHTGVVW